MCFLSKKEPVEWYNWIKITIGGVEMPLSFLKKLFEKPSTKIHSRGEVVKEHRKHDKQPFTIRTNNSSFSSLFKLDILIIIYLKKKQNVHIA